MTIVITQDTVYALPDHPEELIGRWDMYGTATRDWAEALVSGGTATLSTHVYLFKDAEVRFPIYDKVITALVEDIYDRGLDRRVLLVVTGEFGRTPKVNNKAGRDHWARAMCSMLAGGGIEPGQVIGETNAKAEEPIGHGFTPDDLAATFYSAMGIDPKTEFASNVGRPITLVRDGRAIDSVLRHGRLP